MIKRKMRELLLADVHVYKEVYGIHTHGYMADWLVVSVLQILSGCNIRMRFMGENRHYMVNIIIFQS